MSTRDSWANLWKRLDELAHMNSGTITGSRPTDTVLKSAREFLKSFHERNPRFERPKVYPTPAGGLSLEWVLQKILVDVVFSPDAETIEVSVCSKDVAQSHLFDVEITLTKGPLAVLSTWLANQFEKDQ